MARRWRNNLMLADDGYIWHYWDAAGPWDFDEKGKSRHWTSLEHRGYAASDTHFLAAAYDHGLVFDRRDVEMHCNTFLKKIWNGDEDNPQYRALGWFNPEYAGSTILTGLAPYHPKIMELWSKDVVKTAEGWGGIAGVPAYLLARKQSSGFQRRNAAMGQLLKDALDARPVQAKADPQTDPIVR